MLGPVVIYRWRVGRPVGRYVRHIRHVGGAATLIHVDLLLAAPKTPAG
jgi:hypothetical protein